MAFGGFLSFYSGFELLTTKTIVKKFYSGFELLTTKTAVNTKNSHEFQVFQA